MEYLYLPPCTTSASRWRDVNKKDEQGKTALMIASEKGKFKEVKALLEKPGILLGEKDDEGNTALILAVRYERHQVVKEFREHNNAMWDTTKELLHRFSMRASGHADRDAIDEIAKFHGTSINAVDNKHYSALHWAAFYGGLRGSKMLDELLQFKGINLNAQNLKGETALGMALGWTDFLGPNEFDHVVEKLIKTKKVDVNLSDILGDTPLMKAVQNPSGIENVRLLLDHDDIELDRQNNRKQTALMKSLRLPLAAYRGFPNDDKGDEITKYLLEKIIEKEKQSLNLVEEDKRNALEFAIDWASSFNRIQMLLETDQFDKDKALKRAKKKSRNGCE